MGRHKHRDATLILITYRHGLRVSELITLRWDIIDFSASLIHIRRSKNWIPSVHPIRSQEIRALKKLQREYPEGNYVFVTERGGPLTDRTVRHIVARAGERTELSFSIHPHMLRHACGYYLANQGVDTRAIQHYLGHNNIPHTIRYTELSPERFKNFWHD